MLREKISDIVSFVEDPVYSNFKMYCLLILVIYFYLSLFTQNVSAKVVYFWNFRWSAKEVLILLCLWSTLYLALRKCVVSLFYFLLFCHVSAKTLLQKSYLQEILGALRREQWYCFFRGAPFIYCFQNVKCPDSSFFTLICYYWSNLHV